MEIKFCGYKWLTQQPWGDVHEDNPTWWYDPSCVDVTEGEGILRLQTKHNTRINGSGIKSTIGVGLISSIKTFKYGDFEAEVMLPKGTGLFPAFWLWGANSWPPEIDIFEGWSRKSGLYTSKYIPYYSLASNVWWGESDKPESIKSKSHMIWNRFDQCYNHFKLEWRPDRIKIFYNGKSVRKVTDNKILSWYSNTQMRVIFNNGLEKLEDYTNDSVMLVKNFKYTPHK